MMTPISCGFARPQQGRVGTFLRALLCLVWLQGVGLPAAETDVRRDATVLATEKVMPSVVNIATETVIEFHDWYDELLRRFYGPRQQKSLSLGSGVIIDEDGYVLTNFHVVRRANRIQVKLWDGREYDADAIVYSEDTDVALLKLRTKPGEKFKPIQFAADDDLLLGETVLALGNPYGLGAAVTKGILSSKNRRPSNGNEPLNVEDWLQTDAAINPGNSGGPLVNLRGELIGLNVAVYREEDGERGMGVGFSIPVKLVSAALERFFTPEWTDSLWFGARARARAGRVVLTSIQPRSPAADAALRVGDEVIQVGGQPVHNLIGYNRSLCTSAERKANLLITRGGRRVEVAVKLLPLERLIRERLGLTLLEVSPQTAAQLGVRRGEALFIDEVDKESPAAYARLQRGYLLVSVDGDNAAKLRTVAETLASKTNGDSVRLGLIVPRRLGSNFVEYHPATVDLKVR